MVLNEVSIFLKCMPIPLMENIHELPFPPNLATKGLIKTYILITYSFIRHLEI